MVALEDDEVLAALDRAALSAAPRTSLSRWMRDNHDALLARIGGEGSRRDWTALAQVFANSGLRDRSGNAPTPEIARAAWWRARKAVEAARARTRALSSTRPDPTQVVPVRPAGQGTPPSPGSDTPPIEPVRPVGRKEAPLPMRPAQRRPAGDERGDEPYDASRLPKPLR
jgi:hypothetical protein